MGLFNFLKKSNNQSNSASQTVNTTDNHYDQVAYAQSLCDQACELNTQNKTDLAAPLFIEAARLGNAEAEFWAGCYCILGKGGITIDNYKGLDYYRSAAQKGHSQALELFHKCTESMTTQAVKSQNYAPIIPYLQYSAEQGYMKAQFYLGSFYFVGNGLPKDLGQAEYWLSKAVAQGSASAISVLNLFYQSDAFENIPARVANIEPFLNRVASNINANPSEEVYRNAINEMEELYPSYPQHVRLVHTLAVCLTNHAILYGNNTYDSLAQRFLALKRAIEIDLTPTQQELDTRKINLAITAVLIARTCNNTNALNQISSTIEYIRYACSQPMQQPSEADKIYWEINLPAWRSTLAFRLAGFYGSSDGNDVDQALALIEESINWCPREIITQQDLNPEQQPVNMNAALSRTDILKRKELILSFKQSTLQ